MTAQATLRYVELAEARAARGVRVVALWLLPSPWTEAAKAIFHVKQIPVLCVRHRRGDAEQIAWTGIDNAPAVFYDDEKPRSGWAEILLLAERLGGAISLIPPEPAQRARFFGLAHELCGEDGLGWNARLIMLQGSFASGGARSFPLPVTQYLAPRYGCTPDRPQQIEHARRRVREILGLLDDTLASSRAAGHAYLLGARLTALDLYLAAFLTPIVDLTVDECPAIHEAARAGLAYLEDQVGADLPPALVAHRRAIFRDHLPWPIVL